MFHSNSRVICSWKQLGAGGGQVLLKIHNGICQNMPTWGIKLRDGITIVIIFKTCNNFYTYQPHE